MPILSIKTIFPQSLCVQNTNLRAFVTKPMQRKHRFIYEFPLKFHRYFNISCYTRVLCWRTVKVLSSHIACMQRVTLPYKFQYNTCDFIILQVTVVNLRNTKPCLSSIEVYLRGQHQPTIKKMDDDRWVVVQLFAPRRDALENIPFMLELQTK